MTARCQATGLSVEYSADGIVTFSLLDGARALLAEGTDPSQRVVVRHAGSDTDALISTVGEAASTVQESDRGGPYFRLWKPFLSLDVRPSVAFEDDPLGRQPPASRSSRGGAGEQASGPMHPNAHNVLATGRSGPAKHGELGGMGMLKA